MCNRKGQLYSAKAFVKLVEAGADPKAKLLMVGARYIREHEIKYIDEINAVVTEADLHDRVKILDCQDEVFSVSNDKTLWPAYARRSDYWEELWHADAEWTSLTPEHLL